MSLPEAAELRDLLAIEPPLGVLSAYVHVDHADRGERWRIALSEAVSRAVTMAEQERNDHEFRVALRATQERLMRRFPANGRPPDGRGHVGLLEIQVRDGGERWWTSTAYPREPAFAVVGRRPHLQPLVEMLDEHRRRGVVAVTGERARLLEWGEAQLTELEAREIPKGGESRERKAPRNYDIPSGQAPTSSGRDQYEQHLDQHRRGFVGEIAGEVADVAERRGWGEILCFGEAKYVSEFEARLGPARIAYTEEKNLIPMPKEEIAERLAVLTGKLNRRRELALLEQAEQAALAGGRGSLGLAETAQALAAGRVDHLLIAGSTLPPDAADTVSAALGSGGVAVASLPAGELLIQRALETGAAITPVEGEAAEKLGARGGAAALLRH